MNFTDAYTRLLYQISCEEEKKEEEEERYGEDGEFDSEEEAEDDEILVLKYWGLRHWELRN